MDGVPDMRRRSPEPPAGPPEIQLKSPATDPFPPNRAGQSQGVFYQTAFEAEFLSARNEIREDLDPGPHENRQSVLDTLYKVTASSLQPDSGPGALQSVVMTYYHGHDNAPFVVTGFSLWNFRRSDCVALVDLVLQQLWGMTRTTSASPSAVVAPANTRQPAGRHAPPRPVTDAAAPGRALRN